MRRVTTILEQLVREHRNLVRDINIRELMTLVYAFKNFVLASNTKLLTETLIEHAKIMRYPPALDNIVELHRRRQKMDRRMTAQHLLRTHLHTILEIDSLSALRACTDLLEDC